MLRLTGIHNGRRRNKRLTIHHQLVRTARHVLNVLVPKDPGSAVLYGRPALEDSTKTLLHELTSLGLSCSLLVDDAEPAIMSSGREWGAASVLQRSRWRASWRYARAKYVFFTHALFGLPPVGAQCTVNLWHGELTKLIGGWTTPEHCPATYFTAMSRIGAANRCAEFGVTPRQVLIVGSPRNDVILRTDRGAIRERLGLADETTVLLWLPTYRLDGADALQNAILKDLDVLEEWLTGRSAVVFLKPHLVVQPPTIPPGGRLRSIDDAWLRDRDTSLYALLAASDGLITDFSSVWVDYLLTQRPIWIHWPDHERWTRNHLPLEPFEEWAPGPLSTDIHQLIVELSRLLDEKPDIWESRRRHLLSILHRHNDDGSTRRLLAQLGCQLSEQVT